MKYGLAVVTICLAWRSAACPFHITHCLAGMNSRREFIQHSATMLVSAAVSQLAHAPPLTFAAAPVSQTTSWYDRPMRWAQLTLVEDDPGQYAPAFWLDYFKRTHSDAACLSA